MTASSATPSDKPRTKFSSRNLSAVYRAPALRGGDAGGSAGFRGGGLTGTNRMLVLRAPVRGGALAVSDANTPTAPTPINTPSLRKENFGQDIHVNLVPRGKGGGWGSDDCVKDERGDAGEDQGLAPAEPRTVILSKQKAGAWNGKESVVSSLSGVPSSSSGAAAQAARRVFISGGAASGRWGDDAVEEDMAHVDIHRDVEQKREFPDIGDSRAGRDGPPVEHCGEEHPTIQCPEGFNADSRSHHLSNQDARFDSPSRSVPRHEYGPNDRRYESTAFREHPSRSDRLYDVYHHNHGYRETGHYRDETPHSYDRGAREGHDASRAGLYSPQRGPYLETENLPEHGIMRAENAHQDNLVWQRPPPADCRVIESTNVWKMSDAEPTIAKPAPKLHVHHASGFVRTRGMARYPEYDSPRETVATNISANPVRILKRTGPRMLFDHKTGTMVHVDEVASARRSRTQSPAHVEVPKEAMKDVEVEVEVEVDGKSTDEHTSVDSGVAFETARSKKAVFLEKKWLREQLPASVHHECGGVKRASNRGTSRASVARFGKKGLVVEFKPKVDGQSPPTSSTPAVTKPVMPVAGKSDTMPRDSPALAKSYIDAIRQPSTATTDEGKPDKSSEAPKPRQRKVKRQQSMTTKHTAAREKTHTEVVGKNHQVETAATIQRPKSKYRAPEIAKQESVEANDVVKPHTNVGGKNRPVETGATIQRPKSKYTVPEVVELDDGSLKAAATPSSACQKSNRLTRKKGKKLAVPNKALTVIYVPKQQALSDIVKPPLRIPDATSPTTTASVSPVDKKTSIHLQKPSGVSTKSKKGTKPTRSEKRKAGESHGVVAQSASITPVQDTKVALLKEGRVPPSVTNTADTRDRKPVALTAEAAKSPLDSGCGTGSNYAKSNGRRSRNASLSTSDDHNKVLSVQASKPVDPVIVQPAPAPASPPRPSSQLSKPTRRPSSTKPLVSKSAAFASSQKIYKKVYVIKTGPTSAVSSPSAA